jgi:hypothetical protein
MLQLKETFKVLVEQHLGVWGPSSFGTSLPSSPTRTGHSRSLGGSGSNGRGGKEGGREGEAVMEQMKNIVTALTLQVGREGGREGGRVEKAQVALVPRCRNV